MPQRFNVTTLHTTALARLIATKVRGWSVVKDHVNEAGGHVGPGKMGR